MIKKFKKAFTITELVIVIAVIAILAAVLIPTFSTVISKANESAAMQESRNEWTNMSVEVMTEENTSDGYMFKINKGGDDYYFVVIGSEFDAEPVTPTVSEGSITVSYQSTGETAATNYTATEYTGTYQKANAYITIYTLAQA